MHRRYIIIIVILVVSIILLVHVCAVFHVKVAARWCERLFLFFFLFIWVNKHVHNIDKLSSELVVVLSYEKLKGLITLFVKRATRLLVCTAFIILLTNTKFPNYPDTD